MLIIRADAFYNSFETKILYLIFAILHLRIFLPFEIVGITPVIDSYVWIPKFLKILNLNSIPINVICTLIFVWLVMAVVFIKRTVTHYKGIRKLLIDSCPLEGETAYVKEISDELRIKGDIVVHRNLLISIPCIYGTLNPVILLPDYDYTQRELYMVLKHELIHHKYKNNLILLVHALFNSLFWFNIFKKSFRDFLCKSFEVNCDNHLIKGMTENEKSEYVACIIRTLENAETISNPIESEFLLNIADKDFTLKRFNLIKNIKVDKKTFKMFFLYLFLFALTVLSMVVVQPTYTMDISNSISDGQYYTYDGEYYYLHSADGFVTHKMTETFPDANFPVIETNEEDDIKIE